MSLDHAAELATELCSMAKRLDLDAIARTSGVATANEVTRLAQRSAQILHQIKEAVGPEVSAQAPPPLPPRRPNPVPSRTAAKAGEDEASAEDDPPAAEAAEGAEPEGAAADETGGSPAVDDGAAPTARARRPRPLRAAGRENGDAGKATAAAETAASD